MKFNSVLTNSNQNFQVKGHEFDSNYGPSLADTSARVDWGFAQSTVLVSANIILNSASFIAGQCQRACIIALP